jgi:hypothetical protein
LGLEYVIYANDYAGGPVDLSAPVAVATAPTWTPPAIPAGSDVTFLVRVRDTATGLEDQGRDAVFRLILDAAGADVSARPHPVAGLTARPAAPTALRVEWLGSLTGPAADLYRAWCRPAPGPPDFTTPADAVLAPAPGQLRCGLTLTGLTPGTTYAVAVRASNGTAEEPSTAFVLAALPAAGPAAVAAASAAAAP